MQGNASSGIYNVNAYNILCNNSTILSSLNVGNVNVGDYINNNNTNLSIINLNISNLNATSSTLLSYINALTNPTTLNVNNLNVSQVSILNGAVTCASSLSVTGNVQAPQYALTGANPYVSWGSNLIGTYATSSSYISNSAMVGDLIVKGGTGVNLRLQTGAGKAGMIIDTYNNPVLNNPTTCVSSLNVSGLTTLNNTTIINGSVGIGNNNPLAKLHVTGAIASINDASWDHVRMFNDGSTAYFDAGGAESGMAFRIDNTDIGYTSANYSEKMRILANGNVGIGITNPQALLHVNGITKIGSNAFGLTDSVFEVYNNMTIRKNVTGNGTNWGDYVDIFAGTGNSVASVNLRDGADVTLTSLKGYVTVIGNGLNVNGPITGTNIMKKQTFNFTCSTPVVFNGQTYYRYDISLNSYTNFKSTLSGNVLLSNTRKFKWMSWLTNGANNTNHELNYDITYTQRFYSSPGFFVCAYGWPNENKTLSTLSSNGTCLLKNTFDYITVCSSIQNTLMSAIIIDYL